MSDKKDKRKEKGKAPVLCSVPGCGNHAADSSLSSRPLCYQHIINNAVDRWTW